MQGQTRRCPACPRERYITVQEEGRVLNRPGLCVSILSMWLIIATTATGESGRASSQETTSTWRHVQPVGFDTPMPIRLVGPDEPWEKVVQDVQKHISSKASGQGVHVGFYGHGAFV